ncbi:HEPN domain-containing protein [Bdellovibrio sp. HCB-162]|uniref:HEPN domain-containing protein n=1 Tax=Bdellovibrio sp. HCB-162 TaxID=3394234 RepID=UPI0039BC61E9
MRNNLIEDYIARAQIRIGSVEYLFKKKSWSDVIVESNKVVDLALRSLLLECQIDVFGIHDVSGILTQEENKLPKEIKKDLEKICDISRSLRRDRELAYYGSEDLTPSEFYKEKDAKEALESAKYIVKRISSALESHSSSNLTSTGEKWKADED